jgi:hypothetical protein
MTKRKVFISYRRDDAAGFAHAIHDRLVENLPKDQVFMDVGGIEPAAESLPVDLRPLTRMNAVEVRGSRLDADVWDFTGATITAPGGKWPPDEPGGKTYKEKIP